MESLILAPEKIAYHKQDPTLLYSWQNGFKIALPRYFKDRIYDEDDRAIQSEFAQEQSLQTLQMQEADYHAFKSPGQTFEEFRYSRKKAALDSWKKKLSERNKFK